MPFHDLQCNSEETNQCPFSSYKKILKLSVVAHTRNPSIQEVRQADPKFQASPGYLVSGAGGGRGGQAK